MIVELSVENLAIIESATLTLGPGFTIMTGETGAGKSLLVDAIELALGERADSELVRTGAAKAVVRVTFDLSSRPDLIAACEARGVETEDGLLHIHREVFAEGRSQCRIGGRLTPLGTLREIGRVLVDLHGQHEHQSLFHPEAHLGILDASVAELAAPLLQSLAQLHAAAEVARSRLASFRNGVRNREHRLDLLRFQVREIEDAAPIVGETADLEARLQRLQNAERLSQAARAALSGISDDGAALDGLGSALAALGPVSRVDAELSRVADEIRSIQIQLQDCVSDLGRFLDSLESDPLELEEVAARLDGLRRLFRKYGNDEQGVLEFLNEARLELDMLEDSGESEEALVATWTAAQEALLQASEHLSAVRRSAAGEFDARVTEQIRELAMDRAAFETRFERKEPDATGVDVVEFFFSANAGESMRPLSKVASGGEVSRLMLAIKSVLAGSAGVPTLIFDEVDAGLGGNAAATVARKLEALATHHQVIVITHLPAIAARGGSHWRIEKSEFAGRTATTLLCLDDAEREDEIARMLGGDPITTPARDAARQLLGRSTATLF